MGEGAEAEWQWQWGRAKVHSGGGGTRARSAAVSPVLPAEAPTPGSLLTRWEVANRPTFFSLMSLEEEAALKGFVH